MGGVDDDAERSAFIANNLHLDIVRNAAITDALDERDFMKAEDIARGGMELSKTRGNGGMVNGYAHRLVEVLGAKGSPDDGTIFIESLMLKSKSIDWFHELKDRIPEGAAWELVRERILRVLKPDAIYFQAALLVEENLLQKLRELAMVHESVLQTHYKLIGRHFPADAAKHLEEVIRNDLQRPLGGYAAMGVEALKHDVEGAGLAPQILVPERNA